MDDVAARVDLTGLPHVDLDVVRGVLRDAGARFALLFGSRVVGRARPDSDLDVAAAFAVPGVRPWELPLPDAVQLSDLARLPLDVAGRVAVHGVVLLDEDPVARVRWQADTRTRYFDEAWRREAVTRDVLARLRGAEDSAPTA